MKYSEFNKQIALLGDMYSVRYYDYMLKVYCRGEWVGTVAYNKIYVYTFQQSLEAYWGSEKLRCDCIELIHQIGKTKPKNRGQIPVDVKNDQDTLVLV
jgi:hypothetical protein